MPIPQITRVEKKRKSRDYDDRVSKALAVYVDLKRILGEELAETVLEKLGEMAVKYSPSSLARKADVVALRVVLDDPKLDSAENMARIYHPVARIGLQKLAHWLGVIRRDHGEKTLRRAIEQLKKFRKSKL